MKVALHPEAKSLRRDVETIGQYGVPWLEVQSLTDPIHFYKSHPLTSLGIAVSRSVQVMRVRFREQLDPARYERIKRDFFRRSPAVRQRCGSAIRLCLSRDPVRADAVRRDSRQARDLEPPVLEADTSNVGKQDAMMDSRACRTGLPG